MTGIAPQKSGGANSYEFHGTYYEPTPAVDDSGSLYYFSIDSTNAVIDRTLIHVDSGKTVIRETVFAGSNTFDVTDSPYTFYGLNQSYSVGKSTLLYHQGRGNSPSTDASYNASFDKKKANGANMGVLIPSDPSKTCLYTSTAGINE